MTTAIAVEKVKTAEGTLAALEFDARLTEVYDEQGKPLAGYRRVYRPDTDATLSIVSDQYKLIQHKQALAPAVEILGREGWKLKASRIERSGANAFVELTRVDKAVMIAGEQVGQRVFMRNSYDKSHSLTFALGAMVCVCSNGLVVPGKGGFGFKSHHVGDINEKLAFALSGMARIEQELGSRMLEHYSKLDTPVDKKIGEEIIRRSLGERQIEHVGGLWLLGIGRNGQRTGWNLYNGITQYLTHEFKGNWDRREHMNGRAFDLIAGYVKDGRLPKVEGE